MKAGGIVPIDISGLDLKNVEWIDKVNKTRVEVEPYAMISMTTIRVSKSISQLSDGTKVNIGVLDNRYIVIKPTPKNSFQRIKTTKQGENSIKCPIAISEIGRLAEIKGEGRYVKLAAAYDDKSKAIVIDMDTQLSTTYPKNKK